MMETGTFMSAENANVIYAFVKISANTGSFYTDISNLLYITLRKQDIT